MTKAIIMAGGEGTRLRPLTCNRAKPMIPVVNKPVIEHAIDILKKHNITDIIISLFYLPENIQNYFADGSEWDVNISYSVEVNPLGTAGGVRQAIGDSDDTFIILSGDGVIDFDLSDILSFHKKKESLFTIVLTRVNKPTEYGIVITNEDNTIEKFLEKPSWSEVFSDSANTGMYVIEAKTIKKFVPEDTKFDFSLDLFPLLQKKNIPLYGYVANGYWCDVGNLTMFSEVHKNILDGLVSIDIPGKQIAENVWVGKDVEIHPEANVKGNVCLGNFVKVKKGADVSEFTVIGDSCIIEENATIRKSIVLNSTVIGPKCELRGAIIGKRCVLEQGVTVNEEAVVSDDCRIGQDVDILAGIRVWPDKSIEQGTRLSSDLIWGQTEKKTLFSSDGITGTFNVKITPEFASKLGSAIGAYLGKDAQVVISRDTTSAARLIKRALTAGLLSMGVNVFDMEIESVPINRYSTRFVNEDMGIYIQISPLTGLQFIQIRLFNKNGYRIALNEEKKLENIFFRGDYPRKNAFETGKLYYPTHHIESYISNVANYVDAVSLREKKWNLIVDCFNGTTAHVFPDLLTAYGCNTTVLRGQIKEFINENDISHDTRQALENIVKMSKINKEIGVIIGPHGNQISIVDETGEIITKENMISIMCLYYLKYKKEKTINIPITTSVVIEKHIIENGGDVTRNSTKLRYPEDFNDIFSGGESGHYPFIELEYDPMVSFIIILQYLTFENAALSEIKDSLPKSNAINTSIYCTIEEKASIMRLLTTDTDQDKIELIDGVRIKEKDAWVLILPDAVQPLIHLYGEGDSIESRDSIMKEYTIKIKKFKTGMS